MEPIVAAVESLPKGSCAPAVVSLIYTMDDLTLESKRALAEMFVALYRVYTKDGKLWYPDTEEMT